MNFDHHNRDWWAVWVTSPNGNGLGSIFPWHLGRQWDRAHAENAARSNRPLNATRKPVLCASEEQKDKVVARLRHELRLPVI